LEFLFVVAIVKSLGGINLTEKAAGFGVVYFAKEMLKKNGHAFAGAKCAITGSGLVALATAEKLLDSGAIPVTLSDQTGILYCEDGITRSMLLRIRSFKQEDRDRTLSDFFSISSQGVFLATQAGKSQWSSAAMGGVSLDYAFPCAINNEIDGAAAEKLVRQGVKGVFEGASMPCTHEAMEVFHHNNVLYAPAIACNAGAMIANNIEITQNVQHDQWTDEQMEERLQESMKKIYNRCAQTALDVGHPNNIALGAYTAAFVRVADAMFLQGNV
jgi:glutamate dehydrogenase (NADP+)